MQDWDKLGHIGMQDGVHGVQGWDRNASGCIEEGCSGINWSEGLGWGCTEMQIWDGDALRCIRAQVWDALVWDSWSCRVGMNHNTQLKTPDLVKTNFFPSPFSL